MFTIRDEVQLRSLPQRRLSQKEERMKNGKERATSKTLSENGFKVKIQTYTIFRVPKLFLFSYNCPKVHICTFCSNYALFWKV